MKRIRFDWALSIFLGFMIACWFGYFSMNPNNQPPFFALAADTKISGLAADATPDSADLLVTATTTANYKSTIAQVLGPGLADIRALTTTTNELILWNGTHYSQYVFGTGITVSGGTVQADGPLIDIANITATTGDILYWDGSDWVLFAIDSDGVLVGIGSGNIPELKSAGTGIVIQDATIEVAAVLIDIVNITATTGDILYWDGSDWNKVTIDTDGVILGIGSGNIPEVKAIGTGIVLQDATIEVSAKLKDISDLAIGSGELLYFDNVNLLRLYIGTNLAINGSTLEATAGAGDGDTLGALTATTGDMAYWTGTTWEVLVLDADDTILAVGTDIPVMKAIGTGIVIADATIEVAAPLIDIANITANTGDLLRWDGADWVQLAKGSAGYVLGATTSDIGYTNVLGIGTLDMGGGIVELPQGTAVANDGEVNFDFTDGSWVVQHGAAHAELGGSTDVVMAKLIHSFHGAYIEPDSIQAVLDNAPLVGIFSSEFPHGIIITDIIVCKADTSIGISYNVENWDTLLTINAATGTIDAIVLTTAEEQHHEDTITFDDITTDRYICIDLDGVDIPAFTIAILYYEPIT